MVWWLALRHFIIGMVDGPTAGYGSMLAGPTYSIVVGPILVYDGSVAGPSVGYDCMLAGPTKKA